MNSLVLENLPKIPDKIPTHASPRECEMCKKVKVLKRSKILEMCNKCSEICGTKKKSYPN